MSPRLGRWFVKTGLLPPILFLAVVACSKSPSTAPTPTPIVLGQSQVNVVAGSSDFVAGTNRFSFFLLDFGGGALEEAKAQVAFGPVQDGTVRVESVAPAIYRRVETQFPHGHPGGETHLHEEARAFYVVDQAVFNTPGIWAAIVTAVQEAGGVQLTGSLGFEVKERSATPPIGEPVPASRNLTAAEVADLSEIDSSLPPRPELHRVAVAQALEQKRPFVVIFATPTFCVSRMCGPVTEEVHSLYPAYSEQVDFIHIEPYELGPLREEGLFQLSPHTREWNLPSEPWVFVVDAQGRLFAKFEGLVTRTEVEAALQRMLGAGAAQSESRYGPPGF